MRGGRRTHFLILVTFPKKILNQLYKLTPLQTSFGYNMIALGERGIQPKLYNLKEMLLEFIGHRNEVVTRRTIYELKIAEARAHILEGLKKALDHIDEIIKKHTGMEGGIYHITDDESLSTQKIIEIIGEAKGKKPIILSPPKFLINSLAKMGDMIPLPINSKRLKKMTSNLIVSNQKIKTALNIDSLPISAEEGMKKTIESFKSSN